MKLLFRILFLCVSVAWSGVAHSQDGTVFSLVRDASELKDGDVVVIVNKAAEVALSTEASSGSSIAPVTVKIDDNDGVTVNAKVQFFYLKGSSSTWRFHSDNGYLTTTSNAALLLQKEQTDETKTKITIDQSTGEATIKFIEAKNVAVGYNSHDKIFKCYGSSLPNNGEVYIYKSSAIPHFPTSIILDGNSQNADNSNAINSYLNTTVDQVTLQRSFVGDGGWYTLCLPFALTSEDIKGQFQGADFQEFTGMTLNTDNSFSLNFNKVTETKAGVPYMVRPINGSNIQNPVFTNKTIEVDQPATVTHRCENTTSYECSFTGIFNPTDVHDRTIRFISADGVTLKMAAVGDNSKLKGFRAYIKLPSESTAAKINCVDTTNGITTIKSDAHATKTGVYDLCGRYIGPSVKGLGHGVYIVKGRKIIIK